MSLDRQSSDEKEIVTAAQAQMEGWRNWFAELDVEQLIELFHATDFYTRHKSRR